MSAAASPNDPCPCGSRQKFKKCCMGSPRDTLLQAVSPASLDQRTLFLIDQIDDVLGTSRGRSWDDVRAKIDGAQIREIAKTIGFLWPSSLKLEQFLPSPSEKLRAIYVGDARPEGLVSNVFRMALYADEIWIFNPFMLPWRLNDEYSPIKSPEQYVLDYLKGCYYLRSLRPWIEAGIVHMMPNPSDFDPELQERVQASTLKRAAELGLYTEKQDDPGLAPQARREFLRSIALAPAGKMRRAIESTFPGLTSAEMDAIERECVELRRSDPLTPTRSLDQLGGQLSHFSSGATADEALMLSQTIGAFPYTNISFRWREFMLLGKQAPEAARVWSPLTQAFRDLDFKFLNNVDPAFAIDLRQEKRLESFRLFLRKIWGEASYQADVSLAAEQARRFRDQLVAEHASAEEEWRNIDRDSAKWAMGALGGAFVTGSLHVDLTLALPIAGLATLFTGRWKRSQFRATKPMSVFIDLEARRSRSRQERFA